MLITVPLVGAGCTAPLSTLDPGGPAAEQIAMLWWVLLAGAALICALIAGLLLVAWRKRAAASRIHWRRWIIGGGILFPAVVLIGLTVAALIVGERLLPKPDPRGVITVSATGEQYGWIFVQPGPEGRPVTSVHALHIPAGQPVDVRITSLDVIHSFWVPALAGKMDAIPGRINTLRIEAARPGRYQGQCAEFCGIGHAGHRFVVVAHPASRYRTVLASLDAAP